MARHCFQPHQRLDRKFFRPFSDVRQMGLVTLKTVFQSASESLSSFLRSLRSEKLFVLFALVAKFSCHRRVLSATIIANGILRSDNASFFARASSGNISSTLMSCQQSNWGPEPSLGIFTMSLSRPSHCHSVYKVRSKDQPPSFGPSSQKSRKWRSRPARRGASHNGMLG